MVVSKFDGGDDGEDVVAVDLDGGSHLTSFSIHR
jgi:hypothetical protein